MDRKSRREVVATLLRAGRRDLAVVAADPAADLFYKKYLWKAIPTIHREKRVKVTPLGAGKFQVHGPFVKVYQLHKLASSKQAEADGISSEMSKEDQYGNATVTVTVPMKAPKLKKGQWTRSQYTNILIALGNANIGPDIMPRFQKLKSEPITMEDVEGVIKTIEADIEKFRKVFKRYTKQDVPENTMQVKVK